jgi:hypothetical protein
MVQHLQHTSHTCNLCVAATIAHIAGESPTVCDPRTARGTISGRDAMVPCCEPCTPPHTANTNTTSCTTLVCDILLPIGGPFRVANLPLIFSNDYLWSVKWQMDIFVAASVSNQWEITIFTARFPIKCSGVEIFSSKMTGNLECFYIFHQIKSVFTFPTPRIRRVLQVFFHYKKLWASGSGHLCGGREAACRRGLAYINRLPSPGTKPRWQISRNSRQINNTGLACRRQVNSV